MRRSSFTARLRQRKFPPAPLRRWRWQRLSTGLPLAVSMLALPRPALAQEALRHSLAGEAAAEASHLHLRSMPYTIRSGDFRLLATPSLGLDWNDNVNTAQNGQQDDFILRPLLRLNASYPVTQYNLLSLSIGAGYDKYFNHDELSTWRLDSGSVVSFDIYVKDVWINLHDQFQYVQDSRQEAAVAGTAKYGNIDNTAGLSATWDLEDVTLTLSYDHANVISPSSQFQQQDHASELLVGRVGLRLNPRLTTGVEATGSFTAYDQPTLNDNTGYSVGLYGTWQPGDYFQLSPRVGFSAYQFEQTSQTIQTSDLNSWYADLTLRHEITEAVTYSLSAGREVRLGVQSDAIEDWYCRPTISWNVIRDVSLSTSFSYEHGKQGAGNRMGNLTENYDWFGGSVGVNYSVIQKLSLTFNYRFTLRSSDAADRDYEQNVLGMQATYRLQ